MTLEDTIIELGLSQKVKIAELFKPAAFFYENPETDIEYKKDVAKAVVKDCCLMAKQYLPIEIFSSLTNPISNLRGKVNGIAIKEFAKGVDKGDVHYKRVLYSMLFSYMEPSVNDTHKNPQHESDIYGDYEKLTNRNVPTNQQKSYKFADVVGVLNGLLL